jgi:hypothetical protein
LLPLFAPDPFAAVTQSFQYSAEPDCFPGGWDTGHANLFVPLFNVHPAPYLNCFCPHCIPIPYTFTHRHSDSNSIGSDGDSDIDPQRDRVRLTGPDRYKSTANRNGDKRSFRGNYRCEQTCGVCRDPELQSGSCKSCRVETCL